MRLVEMRSINKRNNGWMWIVFTIIGKQKSKKAEHDIVWFVEIRISSLLK